MGNSGAFAPFDVKDCALSAIATGEKAQSLLELREKVSTIHPNSIYYHFWGGRLRTSFEHHEYHNDFSSWAHTQLHDDILAERLELLNPQDYESLEELRSELVDIIDNRLDEREYIPISKSEEKFQFIKSHLVIFQTRHQFNQPSDLISVLPLLTNSSLFYHFIDATRRTPNGTDDFTLWLNGFGEKYHDLIEEFERIDPYFISLTNLKTRLIEISTEYFTDRQNA